MAHRSEFRVVAAGWQEEPVDTLSSGTSVARATSTTTASGALEAEGNAQWLLVYPSEAAPVFVGVQTFDGTLDGRRGTFALAQQGSFSEGELAVEWSVLPDSGTGELAGLSGTGRYASRPDAEYASATLDYDVD